MAQHVFNDIAHYRLVMRVCKRNWQLIETNSGNLIPFLKQTKFDSGAEFLHSFGIIKLLGTSLQRTSHTFCGYL